MAIEISTLTELQAINDDLSGDYVLVNDIDASDTETWNDGAGFEPIGDDENRFTGSFDGQGHTISNLYINRDVAHIGLFGWIEGSTIENIGVEDVDVSGGDNNVGGLVGINLNSSTVSNSYSTGDVSGDERVGGLVGNNNDSEVSNSYSTGTVSGDSNVGGLVGRNRNSEVSNSYATGDVSGESSRVGGLVGFIYTPSGETDEILYSYANSDINPDLDLIGDKTIFGELDTTGSSLKTTDEMTSYSTFDDGGWDITTVEFGETDDDYTWNIVDGDREPFLSFEENLLDVTGTVTLNGTAIENADVYAYNKTDGSFSGKDSTDVNGDYSIPADGTGDIILVAVDFEDSGTRYGDGKSIEVS